MIDWNRLNALRDDIGKEDFADVALLFVSEIEEKLTSLQADPKAMTADDFHFLRGSAVNLGLTSLAEACTHAEAACNAGIAPDIAGVANAFSAAMSAIGPHVPGLTTAA